MKGKGLGITLWSIIVGLTILGFLAWHYQDGPAQPPRTPEITTTTTVGCTGSISVRIEEDGTVTTWCPEGNG